MMRVLGALAAAGVVVGGLALVVAGCGDDSGTGGTADLGAAGEDLSTPGDDLSAPDLLEVDLTPPPDLAHPPCDPTAEPPTALECTGLYMDWATKTIDPAAKEYKPGFELWSDGASKKRWLKLPAGGKIDVKIPDTWMFPVGTKVWKEFTLNVGGTDHRIETRMWWKRGANDWVQAVYRWNATEDWAPRLTGGEGNVMGTTYEVPGENRCRSCHDGSPDRILGIDAVLLAAPEATGFTYAAMQTAGVLEDSGGNNNHLANASVLQIPNDVQGFARPALGFLHANCADCHYPGGPAGFSMKIGAGATIAGTPATVDLTDTWNRINEPATHTLAAPPLGAVQYYRLHPYASAGVGDVQKSMVHDRMNVRDAPVGASGVDQMPPLVSHSVPAAGLAVVDAWILHRYGQVQGAVNYPAPL